MVETPPPVSPSVRVPIPAGALPAQITVAPNTPSISRVLGFVQAERGELSPTAEADLTRVAADGTMTREELINALGLPVGSSLARDSWAFFVEDVRGVPASEAAPLQSREDAIREVAAFARAQRPRLVVPVDAERRLAEAFESGGMLTLREFNDALHIRPPMTEEAWRAFTGGNARADGDHGDYVVREPQHLARYCRTFTEFSSVTHTSFSEFCDWDEVTLVPRDQLTNFILNMSREQLLQLIRQNKETVEAAVGRYLQLPTRGLFRTDEEYFDAVATMLDGARVAATGQGRGAERMREMFGLLGFGIANNLAFDARNAGVDFHEIDLRSDPLLANAFLQGTFAPFATSGPNGIVVDENCEALERLGGQLRTLRSHFTDANPEVRSVGGRSIRLNDLNPNSEEFRAVLTYMEGSAFRALSPEVQRAGLLVRLSGCPEMPTRPAPTPPPAGVAIPVPGPDGQRPPIEEITPPAEDAAAPAPHAAVLPSGGPTISPGTLSIDPQVQAELASPDPSELDLPVLGRGLGSHMFSLLR